MTDLKLEARPRKSHAAVDKTIVRSPLRSGIFVIALGGVWVIALLSLIGQLPAFENVAELSYLRHVGYPALVLLTLFGVGFRRLALLSTVPWQFVLVLCWCALSILWSSQPSMSSFRLITTFLVVWVVFTTVKFAGFENSVATVKYVTSAAVVISLVTIFFAPEIGTHVNTDGKWRGLLGDKNQAGAVAGIALLLWLFSGSSRERIRGIPFILIAAILLWGTVSRTAVIMTIVASLVGGVLSIYGNQIANLSEPSRRVWGAVWTAAGILTCLYIYYLSNFDGALESLVSDPQLLSKRGEIWQAMVNAYKENIWGGTGYGGYWKAEAAADYGGSWLRDVSHGHSGYLDMALQIGMPGLLIALFAAAFVPVRKIGHLASLRSNRVVAPAALLIFSLGANFTESALLERDRVQWLSLLLAIALLQVAEVSNSRRRHKGWLPWNRHNSVVSG